MKNKSEKQAADNANPPPKKVGGYMLPVIKITAKVVIFSLVLFATTSIVLLFLNSNDYVSTATFIEETTANFSKPVNTNTGFLLLIFRLAIYFYCIFSVPKLIIKKNADVDKASITGLVCILCVLNEAAFVQRLIY